MLNNFPYKSIWEYLERHNILDKSPEYIKKAKALYWKQYRKTYQKRLETTHKKMSFCLERSLFREVQEECKRRDISRAHLCTVAIKLLLGQSATMSEGTKELFRVLSRIESLLTNSIRNGKGEMFEHQLVLKQLQDIGELIKNLYDSQE